MDKDALHHAFLGDGFHAFNTFDAQNSVIVNPITEEEKNRRRIIQEQVELSENELLKLIKDNFLNQLVFKHSTVNSPYGNSSQTKLVPIEGNYETLLLNILQKTYENYEYSYDRLFRFLEISMNHGKFDYETKNKVNQLISDYEYEIENEKRFNQNIGQTGLQQKCDLIIKYFNRFIQTGSYKLLSKNDTKTNDRMNLFCKTIKMFINQLFVKQEQRSFFSTPKITYEINKVFLNILTIDNLQILLQALKFSISLCRFYETTDIQNKELMIMINELIPNIVQLIQTRQNVQGKGGKKYKKSKRIIRKRRIRKKTLYRRKGR